VSLGLSKWPALDPSCDGLDHATASCDARRVRWLLPLLLLACACAPARPAERPDLRRYFDAERVGGTIALLDSRDDSLTCSDVALCQRRFLPASTFKITNSIIALETGVVQGPETPLPWDGQTYPVPDWNRDHTLASAMRVSCVPCFRDVARKIGPERMQDWLTRLDYGNRDGSGGDELFWLRGRIRISPLEQVEFVRRLERGELPIHAHTRDVVLDVLRLEGGLYGKTGSTGPEDPPPAIGWFVGFVAQGDRRVYFATLIDSHPAEVDIKPLRRGITERVLESIGALP
jgi:beta-lactamase class D